MLLSTVIQKLEVDSELYRIPSGTDPRALGTNSLYVPTVFDYILMHHITAKPP
jgi:hypothetical protein